MRAHALIVLLSLPAVTRFIASGAEPSAQLKLRNSHANPAQRVHGHLTDNKNLPVRDALISQLGIIFEQGRAFGDQDWIDLVAVSNANGEFELAYSKSATTGSGGATIRGRLMANGKPIPNAERALATLSRISGRSFQDVRMGTNENGEDLYVGTIQDFPSHTLRGNIQDSDGAPFAPNMRLNLFSDRALDRQSLRLPPNDIFEFKGLAKGAYVLRSAIKGFQPKDPEQPSEFLLEGGRKDFPIALFPVAK